MADQSRATSGYKLLPRTAEVIVAAWAPTVEGCLAQAVRGLVSGFADTRSMRPQQMVAFVCDPGLDDELLVELLEEAIVGLSGASRAVYAVGSARCMPATPGTVRAMIETMVRSISSSNGPSTLATPSETVTRHRRTPPA